MITIVESGYIKKISQKNSKFAKYVGYYSREEELLDFLVSNPIKNGEKGLIPAFIFSKFRDEDGPRSIDNVLDINTNYIGLDFDNGITIEEFIATNKKYKFWLYTTTSHTNELHKFRVIIKCTFPKYAFFDEEERRYSREILAELFPKLDLASFGPERLLYIPNDCGTYKYIINQGEEYNLVNKWISLRRGLQLKKDIELLKNKSTNSKKKISYNEQSSVEICMKQKLIKEYMNTFSNKKTGNVDGENLLYRVLSSLKGMNACEEAIEIIIDHAIKNNSWNKKDIDRKINQIWK